MNSILFLFFLLLASILPVIVLYLWVRRGNSESSVQVTLPWFLGAFTAGIVSLLIAAFIQRFFPSIDSTDSPAPLFFYIFVTVALVEEISRLFTIFPLLKSSKSDRNRGFAAIVGFIAGLGFASAENALYGIGLTDLNIPILRAFTAAPLHGACGIRIGAALFFIKHRPIRAIFLILSAIIIHGAYNLIIDSPAIPEILAVPTALAALVISLPMLKSDHEGENHTFLPPRA